MANKQSLKDLQERLAQRLTAAKTEAVTASWLAVEAGGQRYLLPLVQSGEIFAWSAPQAVPYTKPWYLGVASLRGGLHGVIDFAGLVSGAGGASPVGDRISSESRLVSFHHALGINAVMLIDRLLGLRNPSHFSTLTQVPEGSPVYFSRCLIDMQGQTWQEVDLHGLSAEPEFLAIAA
jgi:twitching motility protein PilI